MVTIIQGRFPLINIVKNFFRDDQSENNQKTITSSISTTLKLLTSSVIVETSKQIKQINKSKKRRQII